MGLNDLVYRPREVEGLGDRERMRRAVSMISNSDLMRRQIECSLSYRNLGCDTILVRELKQDRDRNMIVLIIDSKTVSRWPRDFFHRETSHPRQ